MPNNQSFGGYWFQTLISRTSQSHWLYWNLAHRHTLEFFSLPAWKNVCMWLIFRRCIKARLNTSSLIWTWTCSSMISSSLCVFCVKSPLKTPGPPALFAVFTQPSFWTKETTGRKENLWKPTVGSKGQSRTQKWVLVLYEHTWRTCFLGSFNVLRSQNVDHLIH